jgi:N-acetylglucosamine kinase-like BadF-type ATPase
VGEVDGGVIVAVDGGGSKTDAVAMDRNGLIVGRASASTSSPHYVGVEAAVAVIDDLVREITGGRSVVQANVYLSGLDLPIEVDTFAQRLQGVEWASATTVVENDLFALLRSGTSATDAVAVICGTGVNAIGRRSDGAVARFAALGNISGDWGGGAGIGEQALWFAARDWDRRGDHTSLTQLVPEALGFASIEEVIHALHLGPLKYASLARLAPVVSAAAGEGDEIAGRLIDRQAEEIAVMAASCILRLGLEGMPVPVVVGGGVLRDPNPRMLAGIQSTLATRAPGATMHHVLAPPILGAALLALESAGASPAALERARGQLET